MHGLGTIHRSMHAGSVAGCQSVVRFGIESITFVLNYFSFFSHAVEMETSEENSPETTQHSPLPNEDEDDPVVQEVHFHNLTPEVKCCNLPI